MSNVYPDDCGPEVRHNEPETNLDSDMPGLERHVRDRMLAEPFLLNSEQAEIMVSQYQATSRIRRHELCAASVMANHSHLVVGVAGDPDPHRLRDLYKSWATRALTKRWALPANGSFFTRGGSVRRKADEIALQMAVIYVARKQSNSLATFVGERWLTHVERFDKMSDAT